MKNKSLKEFIKGNIKKFGFDKVGFSKVEEIAPEIKEKYIYGIKSKNYDPIAYIERKLKERLDPKIIFPEGKTIICFATSYYKKIPEYLPFSKYLTKVDYHIVLKNRMEKFIELLKEKAGNFKYRIFVDSGTIFEKYWAYKSGIGWIGKNSLLITKEFGSFVFLSEIIVDLEIEQDWPSENLCGDCEECIKSCPTGAIKKEKVIEIKNCLSYLTVEKRKMLDDKEKKILKKGKYVFGCDICQDVCPWNKNLKEKQEQEITFYRKILKKNPDEYLKITEEEYKEIFKYTVLSRVPHKVFIDNLKTYLEKV